jgi:serine/threonine protein phosphatase 1
MHLWQLEADRDHKVRRAIVTALPARLRREHLSSLNRRLIAELTRLISHCRSATKGFQRHSRDVCAAVGRGGHPPHAWPIYSSFIVNRNFLGRLRAGRSQRLWYHGRLLINPWIASMGQFFSAPKRRRPPQLPEGTRIYTVGDVHGRADLLAQVLSQIDSHLAQNPVSRPIEVFLGDYVDRGPDSRNVIDLLVSRRNSHEMIFLKGNHEQCILDFLRDPEIWDEWRQFGGLETLLSYGLTPQTNASTADRKELANIFADRLPRDHLLFLSCLVTSFTCGDFYFVHAGVKPGVALDQQAEKNLLWIRDDFLRSEDDFGKYVVHGHTPVRELDIRSNRANIDTGAFVTGCLTCLVIEGQDMYALAPSTHGASKIANEVRKSTVGQAPASGKSEIPDLTESGPSIAPSHVIEAVAWGSVETQPASLALGDARDACTDVDQQRPLHQNPNDSTSLTAPSGRIGLTTIRGSIFALLLLAAASLVVAMLAPRSQVGANPRGAESRVVGSGVTKLGSDTTQAGATDANARLILDQLPDHSVGDSIPLGIRISGDAARMFVEIGALPTGVTLSSGRPFGSGGWRMPATEVAHAMIRVPQGTIGVSDLAIDLRLADDTVVDHGFLHLAWPVSPIVAAQTEAAPDQSTMSNAVTSKAVATPTPTERDAALSAPASQLDRKQFDVIISRSEKLISEGDVVAARMLLQPVAEALDPHAAFVLGSTYDPIILPTLGVSGVAADISLARRWYEKAQELGAAEAQERLDALAAVASTPQTSTDQKQLPVPLPRSRPRSISGVPRRGV